MKQKNSFFRRICALFPKKLPQSRLTQGRIESKGTASSRRIVESDFSYKGTKGEVTVRSQRIVYTAPCGRKKSDKRFLGIHHRPLHVQVAAVVLFVSIALLSMRSYVMATTREIIVTDQGVESVVTTRQELVGEVLEELGVSIGEFDRVEPGPQSRISEDNEITILRAFPVTVTADGQERTMYTCQTDIGEILKQMGITMGKSDRHSVPADEAVRPYMHIQVIRVSHNEVSEREVAAFETEKRENKSLENGKEKVVQKGVDGWKECIYRITLENGVEVSKELVSETVITEVKNKIVEVGTRQPEKPELKAVSTSSGGNKPFSYSRVIDCVATAYDLSGCGKSPGDPYYGIAASGMKVRPGVVAVDPSVIPMGSKLYIEAPDGSWSYGHAIAGDKGGAIKGNKVDLYYETSAEVTRFGRRAARVYILD